jgi:adenylate cyclase class 2
MAIEIELKAWVDAPETLKKTLALIARFTYAFDKEDVYWHPLAQSATFPASGARVRTETRSAADGGNRVQTTWVTYKTKEVRNDIEVNHEHEFTVSDKAAFEEFLTALGFTADARKRKQGWAWSYREPSAAAPDPVAVEEITVEIALIEPLGYFAELEILANDALPTTVSGARARLHALLDRLGIDKTQIETRYYTEMLQEAAQKGHCKG